MESQLQIKHIGYQDDQPQFKVIRLSDGKDSDTTILPSPATFPVEGRPDHNLQDDLRWYLEKFLELPLGGYLHTAEQIQSALSDWGESCFSALFQGRSRDWFQDARRSGLKNLRIKIASEDPQILAWPWEALVDPEGGTLAHHCRIERQLNQMHDPLALPENLPADCINILLVIARPYGDSDVGFHALSRRMVELSRDQSVPVHIDVLRPPTFEQLRQTLYDKPGFYHIVHFDGHGGYGEAGHPVDSPDVFKGTQGMLIFEDQLGEPNEVEASVLSTLMAEYQIPIMVLNACQSAMIDEQADDAFASVAASLLRAGIRSVVAMGYNLYVSGAQEFVPAFYQRLLGSGNVGEATRAGRQAMLAQAKRVCMLGKYELQDWLVPVLYQQDFPGEERILPKPVTVAEEQRFVFPANEESTDALPDEILRLGDYGLIGRGQAIHALEKALRQAAAGILVHGMAGVGKTTLAKGFVHWLRDTGGLDEALPKSGVFWFGFDGIHSIEYVLNQILEPTYGLSALAAPMEQKYEAALRALQDNRFLLIWDNFESVSGISGTEVTPLLDDDGRGMLKQLLADLKGGKTKILITSRSPERWLNQTACYRLPTLDGLRGEELWAYCNAVVSGLGLVVKRDDEDFKKLIEELDGNPLAIRAILLRLPDYSAKALLEDLKEQFVGAEGEEEVRHTMAVLLILTKNITTQEKDCLRQIGLHAEYFQYKRLVEIFKIPKDDDFLRSVIGFLEVSGFLSHVSNELYKIHPILSFFLSEKHPPTESEITIFTDFMGWLAEKILTATPKIRQQHNRYYSGSFKKALLLSKHKDSPRHITAIKQYFASYYFESYHYNTSEKIFKELESNHHYKEHGIHLGVSYFHRGRIAENQRNFRKAESLYIKAIDAWKNTEYANSIIECKYYLAAVYHELGEPTRSRKICEELISSTKPKNSFFANVQLRLGMLDEDDGNYESAQKKYTEALKIFQETNDLSNQAAAFHQLANLSFNNEEWELAKKYYLEAYDTEVDLKQLDRAAISGCELGASYLYSENFKEAEIWLKKSLSISYKNGFEHLMPQAYYYLGDLSLIGNDLEKAIHWYENSANGFREINDEFKQAIALNKLGMALYYQSNVTSAYLKLVESITLFVKLKKMPISETVLSNIGAVLEKADKNEHDFIIRHWGRSGLRNLFSLEGY